MVLDRFTEEDISRAKWKMQLPENTDIIRNGSNLSIITKYLCYRSNILYLAVKTRRVFVVVCMFCFGLLFFFKYASKLHTFQKLPESLFPRPGN